MAGEPALDKVLMALKTALAAIPSGALVEIDRADDNPFGNAELPARNVLHRRTGFEQITHGETLHRVQIDINHIVAVEAASTNGAALREMEAETVETLWADRTLGGLAQDIEFESSGGGEDTFADEGARPLSITVLFLTPVGDHRTILGVSGPVP